MVPLHALARINVLEADGRKHVRLAVHANGNTRVGAHQRVLRQRQSSRRGGLAKSAIERLGAGIIQGGACARAPRHEADSDAAEEAAR